VTHAPSRLLPWIIALKVLKAMTLTSLGVVLLVYARRDPVGLLINAAMAIHLPVTSHIFNRALAIATGLTIGRQIALAMTAFGYAGLLSAEAVGLTLRRAWARWFTIGVTASLLPIELYEIARRPGEPVRFITFVVNVAIVIYLYRRKDAFEPA
jgi:uncharacterized membrane protein (DUF2068 family)